MPLTSEEQAEVLQFLEDWIADNEHVSRQWHAQEFLEMLLTQSCFANLKLTKYLVDILLRKSVLIVPVGRMVWVAKQATLRAFLI